MNINSYKLIKLLLPSFLRGNIITEFIRVMLLQLEKSYNAFNANVPDWLYKANANASVQSLTHHIKRELDIDVLITELDGKPFDFMVTVNGFVDEKVLKILLDAYILAGRSYTFENSEISYTCEFINHVCVLSLIDNLLTPHFDTVNFTVTSALPVSSLLSVFVTVYLKYEAPMVLELMINNGGTASNPVHIPSNKVVDSYAITEVDPVRDNNYNYTF